MCGRNFIEFKVNNFININYYLEIYFVNILKEDSNFWENENLIIVYIFIRFFRVLCEV